MYYTDLPSNWSSTLEKLSLHTGHAQPPSGEYAHWYAALMRFAKRGFFLVFLTPKANTHVSLRLELSHPVKTQADGFVSELTERLEKLGLKVSHLSHETDAPAILDLTSDTQTSDDVEAILLLLMKVGDYIIALDQDAAAPSPFEEHPAPPVKTRAPSSGFETIGERAASPPPKSAHVKAAPSAFESIGDTAPGTKAPDQDVAGNVSITRHDVRSRQDHVVVELEFSSQQPHQALVDALEHMLRARFDAVITVTEAPSDTSSTLRMSMQPGLTTATQPDRDVLADDVTRYIKKLKDFAQMGMKLENILGVSETSTRAPGRRTTERTTRRDLPSSRGKSSQAARSKEVPPDESTHVVLGLAPKSTSESGSAARSQEPEHTLTPGDFTDERLRREDASGPLVDLVLRHPGYSDRNMSKVLTLLLSIEHSKAMALIERAPCVLSWGIGRERAQTMKSVIEGAGGKVVMVEPDTFAAS